MANFKIFTFAVLDYPYEDIDFFEYDNLASFTRNKM